MAQAKRLPLAQLKLIDVYRKALNHGLSLDEVDDKLKRYARRLLATEKFERKEEAVRESKVKKRIPRLVRFLALLVPLSFILVGFYLLASAITPILGYYVTDSSSLFSHPKLVAPIPKEEILDVTPLVIGNNPAEAAETETKIVDNLDVDYTNLANWFGSGQVPEFAQKNAPIKEYRLDIPAIKIKNARVKVGGTDLNHSLIAYPGTALPGQHGAPVIFGHSILRRFYNPSERNPRRYISIFSKIMTLKRGQKIYITADGVKYTYIVQDKKEVKPEDVYILTQKYDNKRLKLVTCVPEGTFLRRGVVEATLAE